MTTPWVGKNSRFTLLFVAWAVRVLQACSTVTRVSSLLRLDWNATQEVKRRAVTRGLERRQASEMPHLGIDEKNYGRQKVATVITDIEGRRGVINLPV
jgi:transposase